MSCDFLGSERTEKHDVPLSHFEFSYINECESVKELENIVKVLRSGEVGSFPDLERHAEKKLEKLSPNSKVLRKSTPILRGDQLEKDQFTELQDDMKNWSSDMKLKDDELKSGGDEMEYPPIRNASTTGSGDISARIALTREQEEKESEAEKAKKKPLPRGYNEWDKFDIDAELAKVEGENAATADAAKKTKNILNKPSVPQIAPSIENKNLTDEQKEDQAEREKNKGNEAFKAGDYNEAVLYYSRSLSLIPTIHSHNNRAQAYILLKQWDSAIRDCNTVLHLEKNNLKALLRRGVANQGRNDLQNAKSDLEKVLQEEPHNKRAQSVLDDVKKALKDRKAKGKRMVIEEVDGSDEEEEESGVKIIEITDDQIDGIIQTKGKASQHTDEDKIKQGKKKKVPTATLR